MDCPPPLISYELALDDLVALSLHHAATSPSVRRLVRAGQLGVILVSLAIGAALGWLSARSAGMAVVGLVGGVALAAFYPGAFRRHLRRLARRMYGEGENRGVLGPHTLVLDEQGLVDRTAFGEQRTTWAGIERVDTTQDYSFIFVSATSAQIIPRGVEGHDTFVAELRRRREQGLPGG